LQIFISVSQSDLERFKKDSQLLEDFVYGDDQIDENNYLDIDKAWDGILFLLTGGGIARPNGKLSRIIDSGQYIDEDQELGYGPACYLTMDEVKEISKLIEEISEEELKARFNPKKMTELQVYPDIWEDDDSAFEYLSEYFMELKSFYKKAAENGYAVISVIT
jgi:hypothetical protein